MDFTPLNKFNHLPIFFSYLYPTNLYSSLKKKFDNETALKHCLVTQDFIVKQYFIKEYVSLLYTKTY